MSEGDPGVAPEGMRRRLLESTLECAMASGFRFTVEEVARAAGTSRATVYRTFPGGKEQLISEAVTWEVGRFFERIGRAVADVPDLPTRIEEALAFGREALEAHGLLHRVLREDPEQLLRELQLTMPIVAEGIRGYLRPFLEAEELAPGVEVEEAADYLARLFLTYLGSQGDWDLHDPVERRRLVRTQFLAGVLALPPPPQ